MGSPIFQPTLAANERAVIDYGQTAGFDELRLRNWNYFLAESNLHRRKPNKTKRFRVGSFLGSSKRPWPQKVIKNNDLSGLLAEEQGFEPWVDFHLRRFSRPVHSTTLPLLRRGPLSLSFLIRKARLRIGDIRRQFFYEPSKSRNRALSLPKGGGAGRFDCFFRRKNCTS